MCCHLADASSGASVEFGLWRDSTLEIYGIQIVHKLLIGIDICITQRENQLEY